MRLGFRAFTGGEASAREFSDGRTPHRQDTDHQEGVGCADKKRETEKSLFFDVY